MERNQLIFLGIAGIVIFYQSFKGWRLGPIRQLVRIGALAAAYFAGYYGSPATVPILQPLGFPNIVLQWIGGIVIGLLTCFIIRIIGGVLFKKTGDQKSTLVWFVYGVTGSLIGIAFGAAIVMGGIILMRILGTLAESSIHRPVETAMTQPASGRPTKTWSSRAQQQQQETEAANANLPPNRVVSGLVGLKRSIDESPVGGMLQTIDPIPKDAYDMIGHIGQMASNVDAMNRFLEFPGAKELASEPAIASLRDDPEIARIIANHHYVALLKNPKLLKVVNSPKIGAMLKKFNLKEALGHALK